MTLDPPTQDAVARPVRSSWLSSLTPTQISGVAGLILLFSGGGGTITSAMMMGGNDVVKQEDLQELEVRLRADIAKDRELERLAQEQRLSAELGELGHKLDLIARHLEINIE